MVTIMILIMIVIVIIVMVMILFMSMVMVMVMVIPRTIIIKLVIYCNKLTQGGGGGHLDPPRHRFSKWLHIKDHALACKQL